MSEKRTCDACGLNMIKSFEGVMKLRDGRMQREWRWRCGCSHAKPGGFVDVPDFFVEFEDAWDKAQDEKSRANADKLKSLAAAKRAEGRTLKEKQEAAKVAKAKAKAVQMAK